MTPYEIRDLAQQAGFGIGHAEAAVTHFARFAQLIRAQDEALLRQALEWIEAQPEPKMIGAAKIVTALRARLAT